ncbi:MAG: superoxide dismutase, Ni, partial [Chloroflexi bacterium]|nr:superoxide dismutase, Ni [Chloroflexota bacterium]
MLRTITQFAGRVLPTRVVHAHCDIPCGIYDPRDAIQAAQTVIRMTELIEGLGAPSSVADHNSFVRYVQVKEEHAEKAKHDILIIWTDYFKPEHLAAHPDLHTK